MSCVTKEQWNEAVASDKKKLLALAEQGMDITEAMDELNRRDKAYKDKNFKEVKNTPKDTKEDISSGDIAILNKNKPRTTKGSPVTIVSGYRDANGNAVYKARHKSGDTEYTYAATSLTFDQVDGKHTVFGNEPGSNGNVDAEYEKLAFDIFNDQGNALKLFDKMMESSVIDKEYAKDLRKLLEDITDPLKSILNPFNVYIKEKADKNKGATVAFGMGSEAYIKLDIAESSDTVHEGMSAAEVYVHELVHMAVETAMKFKKGPLANTILELDRLWRQAEEHITVDKLVAGGMSKERAERIHEYMFNNKEGHGLSEFIAYGLSNKEVKDILSSVTVDDKMKDKENDSLWHKFANGVIKIYNAIRDMVSTDFNKSMADDRLKSLVTKVWEHNNISVKKTSMLEPITKAVNAATDVSDKAILGVASLVGKGLDTALDKTFEVLDMPKAKAIKTNIKAFSPWATEDDIKLRGELAFEMEKRMDGLFGNMFSKEGFILSLGEYMNDQDAFGTKMERAGLLAEKIDGKRNKLIHAIGKNVLDGIKDSTDKEQVEITHGAIELDLKAVVAEVGLDKALEMYSNDTVRREAIDKHRAKIQKLVGNKEVSNYYISQTMGMGSYMNTGISGKSLNKNATGVFYMNGSGFALSDFKVYMSDEKRNEVVALIDTLASLEAIGQMDSAKRARMGELLNKYKDGVDRIVKMHQLWENDYVAQAYKFGIVPHVAKGEIKDLSADFKDGKIEAIDAATKKKMKEDGYTLKGMTAVDGIGFYVKRSPGLDEFEKQAFAKINLDKASGKFIGMRPIALSGDVESDVEIMNTFKAEAKEQAMLQMNNISMPEMDGMSMLLSRTHEVESYGVTMDKEMYADAMSQDRRAPILLGKMMAEIYEKEDAYTLNRQVFKDILEDQANNYFGDGVSRNRREYIEIGPDAKHISPVAKKFSDDLWDSLPQYLKYQIMNRKDGNKFIAVRRDLAISIFGTRAPSVFKYVPFETLGGTLTVEELMQKHGLGQVREMLDTAKVIWQEIVSLLKIDVVIKMPKVIIDNILSNLNFAIAMGQLPWEAAGQTMKMFKATHQYLQDEKELYELINKYRTGIERGDEVKARINRLKESMKRSPVEPLMKAGLFTALVEDVSTDQLQSKTVFDDMIEKYTDKIPTLVKDVGSVLYVTNKTGLYRSMMMMVQYSDFVARANRYYVLKEQGSSSDAAIKIITDEMVNYNKLLPDSIRWLDKMGFNVFIKYFFGSNKMLANKMKSKPTSILMMNAFLDVANPTDALWFNKDLTANMHSPLGVLGNLGTAAFQPALLRNTGII